MLLVSHSRRPSKDVRREAKALSLLFSIPYVRRRKHFEDLLRAFTFHRACGLLYHKGGQWSFFLKEGPFLRERYSFSIKILEFPKLKKRRVAEFMQTPVKVPEEGGLLSAVESLLKAYDPFEVRESLTHQDGVLSRPSVPLSLKIEWSVVEDGDVFGAVHKA